jgi:AAA family ATPase
VEKIQPPQDAAERHEIPFYFDRTSKIQIRHGMGECITPRATKYEFNFTGLKGLEPQVERITRIINTITRSDKYRDHPVVNSLRPMLLLGAEGTGKSIILERLSQAPWGRVITIQHSSLSSTISKAESTLDKLFEEAISSQPSLMVIDNLQKIAPRSDVSGIGSVLSRYLKGIRGYQVQVIGAARRIVDVDSEVASCFPARVELPLPAADTRCELLRSYVSPTTDLAVLQKVADRTHAFTAADLDMLCFEAVEAADTRIRRRLLRRVGTDASTAWEPTNCVSASSETSVSRDASRPSISSKPSEISSVGSYEDTVQLLQEDFDVAALRVHPTLMDAAYVEVPKVFWADIGGSNEVKKQLQDVIKFTFKNPEALAPLQLEPTRGMLLYGPPGCSKTLTAKALATESGFNFLAVKGPELISKFVGESEYNIREVFRKARDAAPSIIFFDEIDAMARRDTGHDALNTVTALLNEMDGIEGLKGVFVLAATNRPELIDKALLRPGRLSKIMYLGAPGLEARKQILEINTRKRPLSSEIDLSQLAIRTKRYSGAEVTELCRVAAMHAANDFLDGKSPAPQISLWNFERALSEVKPGISEHMVNELMSWRVDGVEKVVLDTEGD